MNNQEQSISPHLSVGSNLTFSAPNREELQIRSSGTPDYLQDYFRPPAPDYLKEYARPKNAVPPSKDEIYLLD